MVAFAQAKSNLSLNDNYWALRMADQQKAISDNVNEHGWHAQLVIGDEVWPAFAYSIGWGITRDWPEVIVIEQRLEVAHGMLAKIWETRDKPTSDQVRTDVLPEFRCKMLKVDFTWYEFCLVRPLVFIWVEIYVCSKRINVFGQPRQTCSLGRKAPQMVLQLLNPW